MRRALSTILLAALVLLAGCVYKITRETVDHEIIVGKTTKREVLNRFGVPYMKFRTPGMSIVSGKKEQVLHKPGEAWLYYVHYLGTLDFIEQETLRIQFNDKGVVLSYTITNAAHTDPQE
jgi:hypothetical protein